MPENINTCPLCHHEITRHFDTRQFRDQTVHNRICSKCGLVFQSPRMTPAELEDFYETEYRQIYQGEEGPSSRDLLIQKERATTLLDFVTGSISSVGRHLDIGSSSGSLLSVFREHYSNQSVGIEPGDAYRNYAQAQDLTVYPDINDLEKTNQEHFDLISMAHVLEHLSDPVGYLSNLRERHQHPDGWLLIEVPNLYCHDSFEIAHLVNFSEHTLRQTVQQSGYSIFKLEAHGRPRSELLPLYLTMLARPGKLTGAVQPEKGVARKRQLGLLRRRILQKLFTKRSWIR